MDGWIFFFFLNRIHLYLNVRFDHLCRRISNLLILVKPVCTGKVKLHKLLIQHAYHFLFPFFFLFHFILTIESFETSPDSFMASNDCLGLMVNCQNMNSCTIKAEKMIQRQASIFQAFSLNGKLDKEGCTSFSPQKGAPTSHTKKYKLARNDISRVARFPTGRVIRSAGRVIRGRGSACEHKYSPYDALFRFE